MAKSGLFALCGVLALLTVATAFPAKSPADSSESSEDSAEIGELIKELQELCKNNSGSDETFVKVMESAQTTMLCAMSAIDLEGLMTDIDTLENDTRTTFFPRYCPQLRTAYSCVDKLVNDFRPCLEEDDFTIVKAMVGILPDATDLVCKNDGEILFKFDEPKYAECFVKMSDSFDECTNSFLNSTDDWDISQMTQEQCTTISGFRQCIQGKLNVCKAPDLIGVYDLFHNALIRLTPCRNYVLEEKVTVIDNNAIDED